jgi:hypothetical protein
MSTVIYTVTHPKAGVSDVLTLHGFTVPFVNSSYTGPVPPEIVSELVKLGYTVVPQANQDPPTLLGGTGVPVSATGSNGAFYFRLDGTAGAAIYQKRAGVWVAVS